MGTPSRRQMGRHSSRKPPLQERTTDARAEARNGNTVTDARIQAKGLETARVELGERQRGKGRRQQQHRGSAMQGGGAADCSSAFLASAQLARACNRAPTRACPPDQVDSNAACLQLLDKIFGPLHGWVAQVGLAKRSPLLTVRCRTCTCKEWHPSAGQAAGPTGVRRLSGG